MLKKKIVMFEICELWDWGALLFVKIDRNGSIQVRHLLMQKQGGLFFCFQGSQTLEIQTGSQECDFYENPKSSISRHWKKPLRKILGAWR